MSDWQKNVEREASKLIARFETYARQLADESRRRQRRTTEVVPGLDVLRPQHWALGRGFNPYFVRAHLQRIAYALQRKIRNRTYFPKNSLAYLVPKAGGKLRSVSVFQIADNAVSHRVFHQLMAKNRVRFSARSYAYRDDVTAHDAIQYLSSELRGQHRVFVAEYDFAKYFENISHDYLWKVIQDHKILVTETEKRIIRGFIQAPSCALASYVEDQGPRRERGVPQGTSVSLFLANIAAWELDRALERLGVSFVRYADDTLIWSTDYAQVCRAAEALHEISVKIGTPINLEKSGGIRLLVPEGAPAEITPAVHVNYLGHRLSFDRIAIRESVVERIKSRVNELLYFNLIREPKRGKQNPERLQGLDRDYVTFIWQLRRYLYGDISERTLRRLQSRGASARRYKGVMSYFPLVDDEDQLSELDRWIMCQIHLALRKRARLLTAAGLVVPPPLSLSSSDLANYIGESGQTGGTVDLRVPSVRRISSVIRSASLRYGATRVARGPLYQYE